MALNRSLFSIWRWKTSPSPGNIPTKWLASASARSPDPPKSKNNFAKRYLLPWPAHQHTADYYYCNYICIYDEDARAVTGHASARLGPIMLVLQSTRAARRCDEADPQAIERSISRRATDREHSHACARAIVPLSHVHT